MVRITRVHGFRERLHQLDRNSTMERGYSAHSDCIMFGGDCKCEELEQCPYTPKDAESSESEGNST